MFLILSTSPSSGVDVPRHAAWQPNPEHCPTSNLSCWRERQLPLATNTFYNCRRRFHCTLWKLPLSHTSSSKRLASLWHLLEGNRATLPCVHSAVCPGQSTSSRAHWSKCVTTSLFLVRTCGTFHTAFAGIHRGGAARHAVPRLKPVDCPQRSKTLWRL
jgi:hypothetical protein